MNKNELIAKATGLFYHAALKVEKHSPQILLVSGVVGAVVSTVVACKATLKVADVLDEAKETIDTIHTVADNTDIPDDKYSESDSKKDLAIVYTQTAVKFVKLYAPAAVLGAASIGCIVASHNILNNRYTSVAAAYTAIDQSFKAYRNRVKERFGERTEYELRHNVKAKEVKELETDENGEVHEVVKTVDIMTGSPSDYARFFDENSSEWTKDAEYNKTYIRKVEEWANARLKRIGFLFLNEVYQQLGIPRTRAGQKIGWVYFKDGKNPYGDNFVQFGLFNPAREKNRDFVNGYERSILLDFNVNGNILDMM